jgi:Ser/Thr protein kinase RdoA (MazF antagonist)
MTSSADPLNPSNVTGTGAGSGGGGTGRGHSTSASGGGGGRDTFATDELAIVLSHFDLGVIESITEFPRGSRKAPKLLVTAEAGKFLLKRRARGRDDPFKVAFCHQLQLFLASKQFPLPHLIGTRKDNNSMLQWRHGVYELFEFIPGQGYPQTMESTGDSGRVLALYHKLLEAFQSQYTPPSGSYHRAASVEAGLKSIASGRAAGGLGGGAEVAPLLQFLLESYRHAAVTVDSLGLETWPKQIVHADWHPGNMLFRDGRVVAVIDYDSARLLPRIIDTANGCLQFSILGGDEDVSRWPDHLDEARFKRFIRGYDEVMLVSQGELAVIPWLMIEALIAEAVFPIAATGTFVRIDGLAFLQMVQRKVYWLQRNADRLITMAEA